MVAETMGRPAWASGHDVCVGSLVTKGKLLLAALLSSTRTSTGPSFSCSSTATTGRLGLDAQPPLGGGRRRPLPPWRPFVSGRPVLFDGGPIEEQAIIGLAWVLDLRADGFADLDEGLGTWTCRRRPGELRRSAGGSPPVRGCRRLGARAARGRARRNAWIVVDAHRVDPFTPAPDRLLALDVLRRQGRTARPHGRPHPRRRDGELAQCRIRGAPVPLALSLHTDASSAVAGVDDAEAVAFRIRKYDEVWISR